MSEDKKNTADFLHHFGNLASTYALICGFTFTTITLLVTSFPDPSEIRVQLVLIFLTIVFDLFVYLITWNNTEEMQYCSYLPPYTR